MGYPLLEKQLIFLVLAGFKPVAEVASGHWVEIPGGRKTVADDPAEVGAFLDQLGLSYSLSSFDGHATDAVVALQPELVEEYRQAQGKGTTDVGHLFGYPDTAVRAFTLGDDALLPIEDQEQLEHEAGLPDAITCFRMSREHAADELAAVKRWCDSLTTVGLVETQAS